MAEGGIGAKLENFRNKIPFLRKRNSPSPVTQPPQSEPEPEPEPQAVTTVKIASPAVFRETVQTPSYRQQTIRDILGTISLQTNNGKTEIEIREILRSNPYLENIEPEKMLEFLQNHLPKNEDERAALLNNQGAIDFLTRAIPENPSSHSKKLHKKWLYTNLIQPTSVNASNLPIVSIVKEIEAQPQIESQTSEPKTQKQVIIEKVNSAHEVSDDQELLKALEEAGVEIPIEDLVELVDYLRTEKPLEIIRRFRPEMVNNQEGSSFFGYRKIKKGSQGTILYFIDKDNALHLRLAPHSKIYAATRKAQNR